MPIPSSVPWGSRLREVLGAPFNEITADHIAALVASSVREAADLDFKGHLYGNTDAEKRELCKDIAAMRNDRGGVIILGVHEAAGVASAVPGVDLSDAEELRMRSIVAAGTAPHAAFEVQHVESADAGRGFYLLIAPPSPQRPHAVIVGEGFRYPRRDGAGTRYMSEVELADMYRSRFAGEANQVERLTRVAQEASVSIEQEALWFVMALAPNDAGALPMSFAERTAVEQWINSQRNGRDLIAAFNQFQATVAVNGKRYTARPITARADQPASYEYAECHSDGAASYAVYVTYGPGDPGQTTVVMAERLIWLCLTALRFLGRAAERAGVYGDVTLTAQLGRPMRLPPQTMQLGYFRHTQPLAYTSSRTIDHAESHHTVPLEGLTRLSPEMMQVARLVLNDLANEFGLAEIPQLRADGAVRLRHFTDPAMSPLAETFGLLTTDDQVEM